MVDWKAIFLNPFRRKHESYAPPQLHNTFFIGRSFEIKKKLGIPERFEKINVILMVSYKAKA